MSKILKKYLIIITMFFVLPLGVLAEESRHGDWDDLDEGEHELYGSEKEDKVTDALFARRESWDNHYACTIFWLYKYTNYPRYTSTRILPFWYHKQSKIDNRSLTWSFLFYYKEIDGPWSRKVIFPVYQSTLDTGVKSVDRKLFYLYWWGHENSSYYDRSYNYFFPFFFYNKQNTVGSPDYKRSLVFFPFLYSAVKVYSHNWSDNKSVETDRKNFSLFHYYHSNFYEDKNSDDPFDGHYHLNLLYVFDLMWTDKGLAHSWFLPLWLYAPGNYGYTAILPPIFIYKKFSANELFWNVLPVGFYYKDYSYKHFNLFGVFDHSWDDKGLIHSWVAPLWFHAPGKNGYTYILPPVFMYNRNSVAGYYWHLFPLMLDYKNNLTGEAISNTGFLSIFYNRFKTIDTSNKDNISVKKDTLWFPIIPLYYSIYNSDKGTSRNLLWLFNWKINTAGSLTHLVLPPFLYKHVVTQHKIFELTDSKKNGTVITSGASENDGKFFNEINGYFHIVPFYYSFSNVTSVSKSSLNMLLPFWYYHKNIGYNGNHEEINNGTTLFFPIVPVLYYGKTNSDGAHRNVFMLFDWQTDSSGKLKRLWAPLFFQQFAAGGYRYYIPFYFRPSGWTPEKGVSFGLLHYHRWAKDENVWLNWLHYGRTNTLAQERVSSWLWLYYSWKNISFFGQPKSKGSMLLPCYFNYEDENRFMHVNVLGGSYKKMKTPMTPNVAFGIGKRNDLWHLDTDFSWLYNVFSISTRVTFSNEKTKSDSDKTNIAAIENLTKIDEIKDEIENNGVALEKKQSFTRENSSYFWGLQILFGWTALEKADTKHHFRVLPLWWLTWDDKSADKILWTPLFMSYRSNETAYFAVYPVLPVLPIYASARNGASTKQAFLVNTFWNEWDSEKKERELTFLWPLVNVYYSPERSGWRIFPVVWHKWSKSPDGYNTWTANPLYYKSSTYSKLDGLNKSNFKLMLPVASLFYYNKKTEDYNYKFVSVNDQSGDSTSVAMKDSVGVIVKKRSFMLPFYWYSSTSDFRQDEGICKGKYTFVGLPLLYYTRQYIDRFDPLNSDSHVTSSIEKRLFCLGYYSHSVFDRSVSFFLPFFYRENIGGTVYTNVLGVFNFTTDDKTTASKISVLPFFRYKGNDMSKSLLIPPFLIYHSWGKTFSKGYYGLVWKSNNYVTLEKSLHVLPLFFSWRSPIQSTYFVLGTYWKFFADVNRQNIYYLYDHRRYIADNYDVYNMFAGAVNWEVSDELERFRLAYGMLVNYKGRKGDYDFSAFWLLYNQNKSGDYFRSSLFPAWYYERDGYSGKLILPPLLTYAKWSGDNSFNLVGLGALWYRNYNDKDTDGRQMLLLGTLWNEVNKPARSYHSRGMLWGLLWEYETEENNFNKLSVLKFLYKRTYNDGVVKRRILFFNF